MGLSGFPSLFGRITPGTLTPVPIEEEPWCAPEGVSMFSRRQTYLALIVIRIRDRPFRSLVHLRTALFQFLLLDQILAEIH